MASTTRERLINVAHEKFYRDGFHTVGLDCILDQVGVTKTTFYNHFASKEDLMLETLRWHDRWWRDTFTQKLRDHGGDAPRDQLLAVFDVIEELVTSDEYNGCIFINVAVEFPLRHDPIHQLAAEHKVRMMDILQQLAGYAGARDPKGLAQELSLIMEGAYVMQHVSHDPETVMIGRRLADEVIDRHLPRG
jgi:AcrR family transcriptional regulator